MGTGDVRSRGITTDSESRAPADGMGTVSPTGRVPHIPNPSQSGHIGHPVHVNIGLPTPIVQGGTRVPRLYVGGSRRSVRPGQVGCSVCVLLDQHFSFPSQKEKRMTNTRGGTTDLGILKEKKTGTLRPEKEVTETRVVAGVGGVVDE